MSLKSAIGDLTSNSGSELHVGPWVTITQERIDRFATARLPPAGPSRRSTRPY